MSENTITIPVVDYVMMQSALLLIKKLNTCIMSVHRNYIQTDTIDTGVAESIMLHFDDWIFQTPDSDLETEKDLETLINDIIQQSTEVLTKTVYTIPANHVGTNSPNYANVKHVESQLHDTLLHMAKYYYDNHFNNLNIIKNAMLKDYSNNREIDTKPDIAG